MKINTKVIEQLKVLCHSGTHPKVWIAAALVYKSKIVSYGVNQMKTHPYQSKYARNEDAIFWHAETSAIYTAEKLRFDRFEQATLYIARMKYDSSEKKNFISGLSAPCEGCFRCIKDYKIKKVIYTLDYIEGSKDNFGVMVL